MTLGGPAQRLHILSQDPRADRACGLTTYSLRCVVLLLVTSPAYMGAYRRHMYDLDHT